MTKKNHTSWIYYAKISIIMEQNYKKNDCISLNVCMNLLMKTKKKKHSGHNGRK